MYAKARHRLSLHFVIATTALLFAGCTVGEGDGPQRIQNSPAAEVPVVDAGFCDALNFEVLCDQPAISNFNGGATIVIDNPQKTGINTSDRVAQMQKFPDEVFGGTRLDVPNGPIDFALGESYRVKVWSPRAVPVTFKLEEEGNPGGGLDMVVNHGGGSMWEELCFDFTGQAVPPPVRALTIIFDNGVLGAANTDPENWTFYYDDIDQVESCAGGGSAGIDPDASLFSTGGNPSLVIPDDYAEITAFGSGSVIDTMFADDETFSPAVSVFSGNGYGANVAQIGLTGFQAGFLGAYQTIDFKVKGTQQTATASAKFSAKSLPNQVLFIKLFDNVDTLRINLTSSRFSTSLENGWFQVSIPVSVFDNVADATGLILESDNTSPTQFRLLLADLGFSGVGDNPPFNPADAGLIPDDVIYASDSTEMVDLIFGTDYQGFEPFGSGSAFDNNVTTDPDFNPAFGITTGSGYGAQVGQFAIVGFAEGFAANYESLVFKAKGLNNGLIRVKLLDSDPYLDIDLTSSSYSTDLRNGWYQVVVPISDLSNAAGATGLLFETDNLAASAFQFLLTDFGFSGTGAGTPADAGLIPDDVIYASNPDEMVDLVFGTDYQGFEPFGSGSMFDNNVTSDADFNPAFGVTTGAGYGAQVGQFAIVGFAAGFAANYESLVFKAKGLNNDLIRVKLLDSDSYLDIDLTSSAYSTALGNGWYQVVVPISALANAAGATGLLFETDNLAASSFQFLLTDFGFSGTGADAGLIPDDVIYASDPDETVDLVFGTDYQGFDPFGSGSMFDNNVTTDPDFNPAFGVTTGDGYGAQVGQFAIVGFAAGFAAGYESLVFKAKGLNNDLIRVKLLNSDPYVDIDLRSSSYSTALGNGWYQVVVPVSALSNVAEATGLLFETDNLAASSFQFLLTDFGFSNADTGASVIPDDVIYASNPDEMVDLVFGTDYQGFEPFGSGSMFDNNVTSDADFNPAFGVTTGAGYGAQVGQFAIVGFAAGFAANYESLVFKAKGLNNDLIRVKLLDSDPYLDINLTSSAYSTALGNGWYQVVVPISVLTNADGATGLLFETDNLAASSFQFLLTDFGFSGTGASAVFASGVR